MYSNSGAGAIIAAFGFFIVILLAALLAIGILYILTLRKALSRCAPQNRTTSVDSPWLLLVPLFHLVWQFILYPNISDSLEREFRQRNLPIEPQPAKTLGLVLAILQASSLIPFVNFLAGPGALICWILYWVKISGYSSQLASAPEVYYPQPPQPQWQTQPPMAAAAGANQAASSSLQPAHHCTACGAFVQPTEHFCSVCGKQIT